MELDVDCPARNRQSRFAERLAESWMDMAGASEIFAAGAERDRRGGFVDQIAGMRSEDVNA